MSDEGLCGFFVVAASGSGEEMVWDGLDGDECVLDGCCVTGMVGCGEGGPNWGGFADEGGQGSGWDGFKGFLKAPLGWG